MCLCDGNDTKDMSWDQGSCSKYIMNRKKSTNHDHWWLSLT